MKIKTLLFLLCIFALGPVKSLAEWDAATCRDLCQIVLNDGRNIDEILDTGGKYTLVNNANTSDESFISLYALNLVCDIYGNIVRLHKEGISNMVAAHQMPDDVEIILFLFSQTNAATFRQQALDLGFKKTKTVGGKTTYRLDALELTESTGKMGRYRTYEFMVKLVSD